jgi:hypothetical protein
VQEIPSAVSLRPFNLDAIDTTVKVRPIKAAWGLGDLAIRYGYERFETTVMIAVVLVMIAFVCVVQAGGERKPRRPRYQLRPRRPFSRSATTRVRAARRIPDST